MGRFRGRHQGQIWRYEYDAINQLTREYSGGTDERWAYDPAGNCLTTIAGGATNIAVFSPDNELLARGVTAADRQELRGQVDPGPGNRKWYNSWAECSGNRTRVSPLDGTFVLGGMPMTVGSNTLSVTVQDVSGNMATQAVSFVKQSGGNGSVDSDA